MNGTLQQEAMMMHHGSFRVASHLCQRQLAEVLPFITTIPYQSDLRRFNSP
jgi:hypothetical protein